MFFKIVVFKIFAIFTGKHLQPCNFIKKETPTQVFSREYCEIFNNSLFYTTPPVVASNLCASLLVVTVTTNEWRKLHLYACMHFFKPLWITFSNDLLLILLVSRFRGNHRRCSIKITLLKNFKQFKHLCWSLFLKKVVKLSRAPLL